jgi:hypothetical protein
MNAVATSGSFVAALLRMTEEAAPQHDRETRTIKNLLRMLVAVDKIVIAAV